MYIVIQGDADKINYDRMEKALAPLSLLFVGFVISGEWVNVSLGEDGWAAGIITVHAEDEPE